jgi:type III restriction enzyme
MLQVLTISRVSTANIWLTQMRDQIRDWRQSGYRGVTSRVTRDLLVYWFPTRSVPPETVFRSARSRRNRNLAQRTGRKVQHWSHLLNQLRQRQATAGDNPADQLPRYAFKMATGSGKTVVMACLILYHYLNRREYRSDTRYCDYFLVVAPVSPFATVSKF